MDNTKAIEDHTHQHQLPFAAANEDDDEPEPSQEMRAAYIADLLEALRLDPEAFSQITGDTFGAALAAEKAFMRVRRSNYDLDRKLAEREEEMHQMLDSAYSHMLKRTDPRDRWAHQMLRDAYQEVDQSWPVLMLLPNGAYETVLKNIIEEMEPDAGDDRLTTEQVALYDISRELVDAFKGNSRHGELAWRRLEASFNQAQPSDDRRVALDDSRTIN